MKIMKNRRMLLLRLLVKVRLFQKLIDVTYDCHKTIKYIHFKGYHVVSFLFIPIAFLIYFMITSTS